MRRLLAAAFVVLLASACADRPPVSVRVEGGNRSDPEWTLGIPF